MRGGEARSGNITVVIVTRVAAAVANGDMAVVVSNTGRGTGSFTGAASVGVVVIFSYNVGVVSEFVFLPRGHHCHCRQ